MARKPGDKNLSPREQVMKKEIEKLKEQIKEIGKKGR